MSRTVPASVEEKVAELEREKQILKRRAQNPRLAVRDRNELARKVNIIEDLISRYRYPA